jgi:hypothetical protein
VTVQLCRRVYSFEYSGVTDENLHDLSKSDAFTKSFAITQCTWLVTQNVARVSTSLPITQLELAMMGYVVCAIVMYGFWWYKPLGVEHVTIVTCTKDDLKVQDFPV